MAIEQVLDDVRKERRRQEFKWGVQNHNDYKWSAILTEETGEVAKAALEKKLDELIVELVQVAAVAVAWVEAIERRRTEG
jgi:NTP pyrophosphatase (non-canonical NTP hydrolase)